jgi:cation-transporting P-type ATPase I
MPGIADVAAVVGRIVRRPQPPRVVWRTASRVHIAVPGIGYGATPDTARAVQSALAGHDAVRWAAVNAPLGEVIVDCSGEVPEAELISLVEQFVRGRPAPSVRPARQAAPLNRVPGALFPLAATAAGLALAATGRALHVARLPAELGSLVQVIDTQPRLRAAIERAIGPDSADVLLAGANSLAQTAAQGLGGLAVDAGLRALQLAEAVLERDSWARAEPRLCGSQRHAAAQPVTPERPRPVPPGQVEGYSERAGLSSAAALAGTLAVSRDLQLAAGVAAAGIPKAARVGREGFAAALGCVLARRGVVVIDHHALRLLDRIDTIVVDTEVLVTGALTVGTVVPLGGADGAYLTAVAHDLFDAERVDDVVTDGVLRLGPLDALRLRGRPGSRLAASLASRGTARVLGLAEAGSLQAVIGLVAERAPGADMLLAAARRSGVPVLLAGPEAREAAGEAAPEVVAGGRRLVATVRGLQAGGATVLLVSKRRRALAAADIGVGLAPDGGAPPWGAHVLAGTELTAAAVVLEGVRVGSAASQRAAQLAHAGTAIGAALALGGARPTATRRSLLAVNAAAAVSLVTGAWSARELTDLPVTVPAQLPPWHAMPVDIVLARLRTRSGGLTTEEASQRQRPLERQPRPPSTPRAFLEELVNPLTPILAGGAVLSASIGAVADAVIVSGVCGLSALMGSVQRAYTERSMTRLLTSSGVTARVLRDGAELTIPFSGLVSGDVVQLGPGDVVPADCRLLVAHAVAADESSLTGESVPVEKTATPVYAAAIADRNSMLYEGTTIAAGHATAVVVATGSATELGKSLAALSDAAPPTGVETRLGQITGTTLPLALGSAAAVVGAGWLRGHPARDTVGAAVGLAVASVPEGLPFLVTAAQLASARRLARRGALVRNPRTIETLGRVDVLCFDKTGTLTEGRLAVAAVSDGTGVRSPGALALSQRGVLAAALRATPEARGARNPEHVTDQAVTAGAAGQRIARDDGHPGWRRIDSVPFEPRRAYHATLADTTRGRLLSVKGAPEVILPRCTTWRGRELRPADRRRLDRQLDRLAKGGHRVLAVAENEVHAGRQLSGAITDMTFAGFVAFGDRVRATAGVSVRELRDAGVHIVMITGDHPATATAIARELDVLNGGGVITGADIDRRDDAALPDLLSGATVIARCTPEHKVRVVRAFRACGRVVAMTGDGANDAAAIRLADVGIALGQRGTAAARAAGDLVVTDDRLETIIAAVIEGRAMWRSVRQAIGILVGGNVGEIGYTLLGTLLAGTSPLSARQLLLVNLLTDLVPALTVALRTPPPEAAASLLAEGPDSSLGSALTEEIALRAAATGAAASAAWRVARMTGSPARARTVGLAALIGAELGQTLLVGGRSPAVAAASLASLGVLVAVVQTPGVSQFFGCTPLGPAGWSVAAISAVTATAGSAAVPSFGSALPPAIRSLAADVATQYTKSVPANIRVWLSQSAGRPAAAARGSQDPAPAAT